MQKKYNFFRKLIAKALFPMFLNLHTSVDFKFLLKILCSTFGSRNIIKVILDQSRKTNWNWSDWYLLRTTKTLFYLIYTYRSIGRIRVVFRVGGGQSLQIPPYYPSPSPQIFEKVNKEGEIRAFSDSLPVEPIISDKLQIHDNWK